MKTFCLALCALLPLVSCTDETPIKSGVTQTPGSDTLLDCCLAGYELLSNGDTVNKVYGGRKQKHGHWISFVLAGRQDNAPTVRARLEEGNYKVNKRQGYWIRYNRDGSVKDSVLYENDQLVVPIKQQLILSGR